MPYTIGISAISDTSCRRKRYLYILARKNKIFLSSDSIIQAEIGKIIHLIVQYLLKNAISYIEYYYFRNNLTIEKSIEKTLRKLVEYPYFLMVQKQKKEYITKTDFSILKNEIIKQIPTIAKEAPSLLVIDDNNRKIHSKIIDDEFTVSYQIFNNILMTGKIDLVGYDQKKKNLFFIEIKTGKIHNYITDARRQLKLYKEIYLKSKLDIPIKNIELYLWSTKPGDKEKKYGVISTWRITQLSEIKKTKEAIRAANKIEEESELPNKKNSHFARICDYCEYCAEEKRILMNVKTIQKDILQFF